MRAAIASLVIGVALTACSGGGSVVTVNGEPISKSDFYARLADSPAARPVFQQLVQQTLLEQYAKNSNIAVTSTEIDAKENEIKANFPGDTWNQMLQARGLSEDDVRSFLKDQIILDKALAKDIKITPAQIKDYFDKNHARFDKPAHVTARHISVPNLAMAKQVEAGLKAGQNFADLAKQYSVDPGAKDTGGELTDIPKGQMTPGFDKYAFSAPIGQISPPIKTPFGYQIILVQSRTPAQKATLANSTSQIVEQLRQQQEGPLTGPFLQGLQQKADIKVSDSRFYGLFPTPPPAAASATAAPSTAPSSASSPAPAGTK